MCKQNNKNEILGVTYVQAEQSSEILVLFAYVHVEQESEILVLVANVQAEQYGKILILIAYVRQNRRVRFGCLLHMCE